MPIYTFRNRETGQSFDAVMRIAEYDAFLAARPELDRVIVPPQIMSDIPEYRSPINGKPITSRSARRDDLERSGCREWDPADSPTGGKFRNARFAKKHGREVSEEFRDHPLNKPVLNGA